MNESDVSRKIREELVAGGAMALKLSDRFHASRPDILFVYQGVTGYIETKMHPEKPTPLQELTLQDLADHGAPTYVLWYVKKTKDYKVLAVKQTETFDDKQQEVTSFADHRKLVEWLLKSHPSSIKQN